MQSQLGKLSLENLGDKKEDQCDFNPFVSQRFCCSEKQTGKGKKCEQLEQLPFRKALILSKLLDSGEGQKQNLQLQRAAAWREIWGQSC